MVLSDAVPGHGYATVRFRWYKISHKELHSELFDALANDDNVYSQC